MPSCRLGHHGVLCAYCAEGWVKAKGLCMPCQSFDTGKLLQMVAIYGGLCVFFWRKATLKLKKAADVDENAQSSAIGIITFFFQTVTLLQVRKTPSWPRSWANFSLFYSYIPTGMHGPTCIFWANLTPFSLQIDIGQIDVGFGALNLETDNPSPGNEAVDGREQQIGGSGGSLEPPGPLS
jgi:hypothetical protein